MLGAMLLTECVETAFAAPVVTANKEPLAFVVASRHCRIPYATPVFNWVAGVIPT